MRLRILTLIRGGKGCGLLVFILLNISNRKDARVWPAGTVTLLQRWVIWITDSSGLWGRFCTQHRALQILMGADWVASLATSGLRVDPALGIKAPHQKQLQACFVQTGRLIAREARSFCRRLGVSSWGFSIGSAYAYNREAFGRIFPQLSQVLTIRLDPHETPMTGVPKERMGVAVSCICTVACVHDFPP
jgi:hypothetical protein